MMEKVYTLHEWAEVSGQSYWFWWKLTKSGRLPCIRTAGKILVRESTVEQWLSDQEKASALTELPIQYGTLRRID